MGMFQCEVSFPFTVFGVYLLRQNVTLLLPRINQSINHFIAYKLHHYYNKVIQYKYITMWSLNVVSY